MNERNENKNYVLKVSLCFSMVYWGILTFCSNVFPQNVGFCNSNSIFIAVIMIVMLCYFLMLQLCFDFT